MRSSTAQRTTLGWLPKDATLFDNSSLAGCSLIGNSVRNTSNYLMDRSRASTPFGIEAAFVKQEQYSVASKYDDKAVLK